MKSKVQNKIIDVKSILLYLFALAVFCGVLTYSMVPFSGLMINIRYVLIGLMFLIAVINEKHSVEQWFFLLLGITIISISLILNNIGMEYLFMMMAMFAVSTISPKKILKYSSIIFLFALMFLAICSFLKLIPNLTFYRNNVLRQSLGTIYPLTFAGYVFYADAAWIVTQDDKKFMVKEILVLILSAIIVFKITAARNDTAVILLLGLATIVNRVNDKYNKVILSLLTLLVFLFTIFSVFITTIIPYDSNIFNFYNNILNNRLGLQYTLFAYYSPKFFGQIIPQVGAGGVSENIGYYFYIDNSYTRLLFMLGILFTIFLLFLLLRFLYKLINEGVFKLVYVILIVILSGTVEDSFINPVVNIFLYLLLIDKTSLINEFKFSNNQL